MDSLTRDEVVQTLANRIAACEGREERSMQHGNKEPAKNANARSDELWGLAIALDLGQELDDALYLMEEGPE